MVVARDAEISRTTGYMDRVISHFEAGCARAFDIRVGMVVPEVIEAIRGGSKRATINVCTRR